MNILNIYCKIESFSFSLSSTKRKRFVKTFISIVSVLERSKSDKRVKIWELERDGNAHVRGYVQPYTKWYDIAYGRGVALLLPDGLPAFLVQCESIPVCRFT